MRIYNLDGFMWFHGSLGLMLAFIGLMLWCIESPNRGLRITGKAMFAVGVGLLFMCYCLWMGMVMTPPAGGVR